MSPGNRPAANLSPRAALLSSFLVFLTLSFPLSNKQDRFGKKNQKRKEKLRPEWLSSSPFFSITSSSSFSSSSSGMCCKERELRVWILHLGKGKVVRHRRTPDLQNNKGAVSLCPEGWREGRTERGMERGSPHTHRRSQAQRHPTHTLSRTFLEKTRHLRCFR